MRAGPGAGLGGRGLAPHVPKGGGWNRVRGTGCPGGFRGAEQGAGGTLAQVPARPAPVVEHPIRLAPHLVLPSILEPNA